MSVRRVLVGCAVLSLQDAFVFYPCCKDCFSRLDAEQRDATRYRCSRCGYRCLKDQVDYRYRLPLLVTRDTCTFGVTVFGNSLNSFFGIHASGLQRLVENSDEPVGPSGRSTLLVKAVEDCFLGRYFIFGIKVSGTEREPWLEDADGNEFNRRERAQFVATQIILPTASGVTGCTVLSYYQRLLQKASEYEVESADPSKTFRPYTAPLLISGPSPNSTFSDVSMYPSGLLSQSLLRPQHQDHTFTPTPPWQQSLGLVTSSAEQEERSSQDGGDQNSRLTEHSRTPHSTQRVYSQDHPGTEERTVPLLLECSFHSDPSFTGYSNSSFIEGVENSFSVKTCLSLSQPRYKSCRLNHKELPTTHQTKTFLSSSFPWDDLPFSESLTEFLCEQDKDLNVLNKTPNLNMQHPKLTVGTFVEVADLAAEPASACFGTEEIISTDKLHDFTNTATPDEGNESTLSYQDCNNCAEHMNRSKKGEIPWDYEAFLCTEKQEEHNEVDGYNCSADLFGDSLIHTETHETLAQTVSSPSDACFQLAEMSDQHLKNESVSHSTPYKQKLKNNLCIKRDSIDLKGFDFVPPSQSTPIIKVCRLAPSPGNTSCRSLKDESSKGNVMQMMISSRCKNKVTPGRRFKKPEKKTDRNPVGQHVTLQRGTFNFESPMSTSQKHDSEASDVSDCDYEGGEGVVGPSPAHNTQRRVTFRKEWRMENSRKDSGCKRKVSREDKGDFSRLSWDQTQKVFHTNETVGKRCHDGSKDDFAEDGNQTCNWSRDLFSDSI